MKVTRWRCIDPRPELTVQALRPVCEPFNDVREDRVAARAQARAPGSATDGRFGAQFRERHKMLAAQGQERISRGRPAK